MAAASFFCRQGGSRSTLTVRSWTNYKAEKQFVIHDTSLREAVYRYFQHKFVYEDDKKAKFSFERPYWERTQEEMRAEGF
jgi:hypothetical protein